jgi:hypothetical protein
MRQVTVTIPDEYYDNLIQFLKPIPDTVVDNSQEEYNRSIEKMVLERLKNAKPEDYVDARDSVQRLKLKYGF